MKQLKVATKLAVFTMVCVLSAVLVVNTLTNPVTGNTVTYHAIFTNAEGLRAGSDVRVAGVRVGSVESVALTGSVATVSFGVRVGQRVPAAATASVRYADLLGARYLEIQPGKRGASTKRLEAGATIPNERTSPPLDLTALLNGFKPLFEVLEPNEVNKLANQIVSVLQGEGGKLSSLLRHVVTFTSTLTGKEEAIAETITNLNKVLGTVSAHREDIKRLVDALGLLAGSVADNRDLIANALRRGADLANSIAGLLDEIGPTISDNVRALRDVTGTLRRNQDKLLGILGQTPNFLNTMNRTLDYGSWVNVYVCNLSVRIVGKPLNLGAGPHSEVCR